MPWGVGWSGASFCSQRIEIDEGVGSQAQARPGTPLRIASLQLRTIEKGLGEDLNETTQARRVSIRGIVSLISDDGSSTSIR